MQCRGPAGVLIFRLKDSLEKTRVAVPRNGHILLISKKGWDSLKNFYPVAHHNYGACKVVAVQGQIEFKIKLGMELGQNEDALRMKWGYPLNKI